MFKISPEGNPEIIKKYEKQCSFTYKVGAFLYAMTDCDSGEIMGIAQFDIKENCGYILNLKEKDGLSDFEAMFILGRQTMNFINTCGPDICLADKKGSDNSLLKAIGFTERQDNFYCDMTGMFEGKCSH